MLVVVLFAATAAMGRPEDMMVAQLIEFLGPMPPPERVKVLSGVSRVMGWIACLEATRASRERLRTKPGDKLRIAVHESGHALALLEAEQRKQAFQLRCARLSLGHPAMGGFTLHSYTRKLSVIDAEDLLSLMEIALAGRAAEQELLGSPTVGAGSDIDLAKYLAKTYIDLFSLDVPFWKRTTVDRLLTTAYRNARRFARDKHLEVGTLAKALYLEEVISRRRARQLLRSIDPATRPRGGGPIEPPPVSKPLLRLREAFRLTSQLLSTWCFFSEIVPAILAATTLPQITEPPRREDHRPRIPGLSKKTKNP
ncbi:hypothetical protein CTAYLR_010033 [Chrysophaeum taylorii]|uniref:Peptidase M41 domain-containing protein n=1 Tax=Chrysophaeum taylorii TaxID=2483200 RepID=A0AAD7XM89_9STRA|nr:hypothetical protein CTAYLR_010033 [Chrysophaeum taylorii]